MLQSNKFFGPGIAHISLDTAEDKGPHVLLLLSLLVLAVIYNAVKDVSGVSLNSVLDTLRGIRMTFIVNGRNVVKRLDAKGDEEIWVCERLGITA